MVLDPAVIPFALASAISLSSPFNLKITFRSSMI